METAHENNWLKAIGVLIVLMIISNLAFLDWQLLQNKEDAVTGIAVTGILPVSKDEEPRNETLVSQTCDKECQERITAEVAKAVAALPTPQAKTETKIVTQEKTSKTGTTYIPLNGSSSTTSTSWVDISSSDVYIKAEDYGSKPYISLEASLKTSHEGGLVYVRLFDVTNGIAVDGSELSTSSPSFVQVSSGSLPFWRGNNLYRLQIKSLDNQLVYFSSGRVKIVAQ